MTQESWCSLFVYWPCVNSKRDWRNENPPPRSEMTKNLRCQGNHPPGINLTNYLAKTFFSLKWSFTNVLVKKKIEIGALVSGSEMSKFGSWNVTKHCAHGRDLTNKNEIDALVSWWDMSKFGSWNLTKHCANCFLALVSGLQNFISSPCIWRVI